MDSLKTLAQTYEHIYTTTQSNQDILSLVEFLAKKIREKHEAGFLFNGLNPNTLYVDVEKDIFIYKLLACRAEARSAKAEEIARDLAELQLPDDYWRVFKHIYFYDKDVPAEFSKLADQYRQSFDQKNLWLWDEKSSQAMVILNRDSKKRYRDKSNYLKILYRVLKRIFSVKLQYKKTLKQAFQSPVLMRDKIGVALHPRADYIEHEIPLLKLLGNCPVLIRFACHESKAQWSTTIALIDQLHPEKIKISVALLQNRDAVIHPEQWRNFLEFILPKIHEKVQWCEIGHATNRVKWGIWTADEYVALAEIAQSFKTRYPALKLIGPAVIDFEWYRMIDTLGALPKGIKLDAVSQHLYVDRRGAPENYQGNYSTLEKCAMSKAIAQAMPQSENKFIISEVNWPLQDTDVWSPIGSPYTAPEWFRDRPGVSESDYANYLIRYLAITLCSGFVDEVFLWRLSAHGYGLVDDQDNFRQRSTFFALKTFLEQLGDAQFIKRLPSPKNSYLLQFEKNNQVILLAWTSDVPVSISAPLAIQKKIDLLGEEILYKDSRLHLTGTPQYFV
jgi:hypothetical protein